MKLLTVGNPKVEKGAKFGYLNAILHLAPGKLAKRGNVCIHASGGCLKGCLNTAGRGGMFKAGENTNKIQQARIRKTQLLFDDPDKFEELLLNDMRLLEDAAIRSGLEPALRLNGTSDIDWFNMKHHMPASILWAADRYGIQLYDYTKDSNKILNNPISDYHLTFSRSECNDTDVTNVLASGHSVAVVFRDDIPNIWNNTRVINGDLHDLRFLDPPNVVVGLKAKGRAKKDTTGFVV
jgi:hypothetical protein